MVGSGVGCLECSVGFKVHNMYDLINCGVSYILFNFEILVIVLLKYMIGFLHTKVTKEIL